MPRSKLASRSDPTPLPVVTAAIGRGKPIACDQAKPCSSGRIAGTSTISAHALAGSAATTSSVATWRASLGASNARSVKPTPSGSATAMPRAERFERSPRRRRARYATAPPSADNPTNNGSQRKMQMSPSHASSNEAPSAISAGTIARPIERQKRGSPER